MGVRGFTRGSERFRVYARQATAGREACGTRCWRPGERGTDHGDRPGGLSYGRYLIGSTMVCGDAPAVCEGEVCPPMAIVIG